MDKGTNPKKAVNFQNSDYSGEKSFRGSWWGVLIIFTGAIFLLNNLGILPQNIWSFLWHFWPIILILFGLEIILGKSRFGSFLVLILAFILSFLIIIYTILISNPTAASWLRLQFPWLNNIPANLVQQTEHKNMVITKDKFPSAAQRSLNIDTGSGNLVLADDPKNSDFLNLNSDFFAKAQEPLLSSSLDKDNLEINLTTSGFNGFEPGVFINTANYMVTLGQSSLPTDLSVQLEAGKGSVNLIDQKTSNINLKIGIGVADLNLTKDSLPSGKTVIDVGAGRVNLNLPKEVGFQIDYSVGAGKISVNSATLGRSGTYTSSNYDSSPTKAQVKINVGSGSVNVTTS